MSRFPLVFEEINLSERKVRKINKKPDLMTKYQGLTFAEIAGKIDKKYKNRELDKSQMNAYEAEIQMLQRLNDEARARQQQIEGDAQTLSSVEPSQVAAYGKSLYQGGGQLTDQQGHDLFFDYNNSINESPGILDKTKKALKSPYAPALAGSLVSTLYNASVAFGQSEKEVPRFNTESNKVKELLSSRGTDFQSQLNEIESGYNTAREGIDNVRSANVRTALQSNLNDQLLSSRGESAFKQSQYNDQLKSSFAQMLNNLGQQDANELKRVDVANAQNRATKQNLTSQLFANVAEDSKFFTRQNLNDQYNNLMGTILSAKYTDFGIRPELMEKLRKGQLDNLSPSEIIELQKNPNAEIQELLSFRNFMNK